MNQGFLNSSCCKPSKVCYHFRILNVMICKSGRAILLLALGLTLCSPLHAAETPVTGAKTTNSTPSELKPGPDAAKIAFVTGAMLENYEYLHHDFDATISARLFDAWVAVT